MNNKRPRKHTFAGTRWAKEFERSLVAVDVRMFTGYDGPRWRGVVPKLRRGYYWVTDQAVAGDAPKDFIRVYEPGSGARIDPGAWPAYIAKVGHKWYPAESVTEQLMTRIGECLGFRMACSKLMSAGDQIRFLSRYFLGSDESLVHGAEVIAGYLVDDQFVTAVEQQHLEKEIFTFQVLCAALRTRFPADQERILLDFVRMIAFDALVGNQDRHLYNWGIIVHPKGIRPAAFSPIYDTARGLFWNTADAKLSRFSNMETLLKYVQAARPLIGWDGEEDVNHFRLVGNIAREFPEFRHHLTLFGQYDRAALERMVDQEFWRLLSRPRLEAIKQCLRLRFELYNKTVEGDIC